MMQHVDNLICGSTCSTNKFSSSSIHPQNKHLYSAIKFLAIKYPQQRRRLPPIIRAFEEDASQDASSSHEDSTTSQITQGPFIPSQTTPSSSTKFCRECRGRRIIKTTAGRLPCPVCVPWRQRPDYTPGQLLSIGDLNLISFDGTTSDEEPPKASSSDKKTPSSKNIPLIKNTAQSIDTLSSDADDTIEQQPRRRGSTMTEEKRQAIRQAMKNRGPLPSDHRRRISNAMRAKYAADPTLRQAGKPKQCSICGQKGHNKKRCPQNNQAAAVNENADANLGNESDLMNDNGDSNTHLKNMLIELQQQQKERTCRMCGQKGHNRRSCPQLASSSPGLSVSLSTNGVDNGSSNSNSDSDNRDIVPAKIITIETASIDATSDIHTNATITNNNNTHNKDYNTTNTNNVATALPTTPTKPPPNKIGTINRSVNHTVLRSLPSSTVALSPDGSIIFPLPTRQEHCVRQAASAVLRAWDDGIRRQSLELLLPQENSVADGGWPGGIRQQFRVALPMIEGLLLALKRAQGLEGRITAELLDEGDCVGAWQSEKLAAVLFPTGDSFPAVRRLDDGLSGKRLLLVVNPQWQPQGQIVSDFGFGNSRKTAERFISSLEDVYYLKRVRVLGDEVRVLRCYPGLWQVHYITGSEESELLSLEESQPTYERLLELLKGVRGSLASKSWLDRVLTSGYFDKMASYSLGSDNDEGNTGDVGDNVERDIVTGEVVSHSE